MNISILWDRLAGELLKYVNNFCVYKSNQKIKPSYNVDYDIECLEELLQSSTNIDSYWVHIVSGCKNINDLPPHLQKLVIQYLPRFIEKHPEYSDANCLQLNEHS